MTAITENMCASCVSPEYLKFSCGMGVPTRPNIQGGQDAHPTILHLQTLQIIPSLEVIFAFKYDAIAGLKFVFPTSIFD
ncbi:hypothetical protein JYQ62_30865 [Nostoc sp. UHCC 0702]|nr:hypothetical protein JYQ62_30865 [Nostoc sp. UHCC 0702]